MLNRVFFWTAFGAATRALALGIQMRPIFDRPGLVTYPIFMAVGASFGYWMQTVEDKQTAQLEERRKNLLAKRERKAQRDAERASAVADAEA